MPGKKKKVKKTEPHKSEAIVKFAELALRSSILVNGGGCLSLLTFLGNIAHDKVIPSKGIAAMIVLSLGVLLAVTATGSTYISQCNYYVYTDLSKANCFRNIAIIFIALSYIAFLTGIILASLAIGELRF